MFISPTLTVSLISILRGLRALGPVSKCVLLCVSLTLAACGGGGGGGASAVGSDTEVTPDPDPVVPDPNPVGVSLSGTILVSNNSFFDSDTPDSDPGASVLNENNTIQTAQDLLNPVTLGGYLSGASGTYANGSSFPEDSSDVFGVSISAGQTITLEVQYADNTDTSATSEIALNLNVATKTNPGLELFTADIDRELTYEINVDQSGDYFVTLEVEDTSRPIIYVLSVGQQLGLSNLYDDSSITSASVSANFVEDEIIVKLKDNPSSGDAAVADRSKVNAVAGDILSGMTHVKTLDGLTDVYRVQPLPASYFSSSKVQTAESIRLAQKTRTLELVHSLNQLAEVEYAEPNFIYSSLTINSEADIQDDLFDQQWNMTMVQAPAAWRVSSGEGVVIGVVDTGINPAHPDLNDNILFDQGYDFVSTADNEGDSQVGRDADATDEGTDFHGTHVAGIMSSEGNVIGIRGIAYDAEVLPVRALGSDGTGTASDIANAIRYAAGLENESGLVPATPADIINLSLGSPEASQTIRLAIEDALANGVFVVAAAGNEAEFGDIRPTANSYPAAFDGVIAVGAVNEARQRSSFSNIGTYIDVAAPGGASSESQFRDNSLDGVLSTIFGREYEEYVGTSMAAPHVSGVIALMIASDPTLDLTRFNTLLNDGVLTDDIDDSQLSESQNRQFFGAGLINASKALAALGREIPTTLTASPGSLRLSTILEETTFVLGQTGEGGVSISEVTATKDWVVLERPETLTKLGAYSVSVSDTFEQTEELVSADIIVSYSIEGVEQDDIVVRLQVLKSPASVNDLGDSFQVFLSPVDETSGTPDYDNALAISPTFDRNRYFFDFDNVEPGTYRLSAGTDFDGDGDWEEEGESYGFYFNNFDPQNIVVGDDDLSTQDFSVRY